VAPAGAEAVDVDAVVAPAPAQRRVASVAQPIHVKSGEEGEAYNTCACTTLDPKEPLGDESGTACGCMYGGAGCSCDCGVTNKDFAADGDDAHSCSVSPLARAGRAVQTWSGVFALLLPVAVFLGVRRRRD
jgi:hypothetical protein